MLPSYHGLSRVNILFKENMQLKAFTFSETLDLVCCFSHLKKQLLWLNCTEIAFLGKIIPVLNCKSKHAFRDSVAVGGTPLPPPITFLINSVLQKNYRLVFFCLSSIEYLINNNELFPLLPSFGKINMFQFSVPYRFNWRSRVVEIDRYGILIFILLNVTGCVTQPVVWYKNVFNFWYFICNHWWKTSKGIWSVYYSLKFYISTRVSHFLPFPGNRRKIHAQSPHFL